MDRFTALFFPFLELILPLFCLALKKFHLAVSAFDLVLEVFTQIPGLADQVQHRFMHGHSILVWDHNVEFHRLIVVDEFLRHFSRLPITGAGRAQSWIDFVRHSHFRIDAGHETLHLVLLTCNYFLQRIEALWADIFCKFFCRLRFTAAVGFEAINFTAKHPVHFQWLHGNIVQLIRVMVFGYDSHRK